MIRNCSAAGASEERLDRLDRPADEKLLGTAETSGSEDIEDTEDSDDFEDSEDLEDPDEPDEPEDLDDPDAVDEEDNDDEDDEDEDCEDLEELTELPESDEPGVPGAPDELGESEGPDESEEIEEIEELSGGNRQRRSSGLPFWSCIVHWIVAHWPPRTRTDLVRQRSGRPKCVETGADRMLSPQAGIPGPPPAAAGSVTTGSQQSGTLRPLDGVARIGISVPYPTSLVRLASLRIPSISPALAAMASIVSSPAAPIVCVFQTCSAQSGCSALVHQETVIGFVVSFLKHV